MKILFAILFLGFAILISGCTSGSFNETGGEFQVSVPSSDSVNAVFTESAAPATVVGGPIQSNIATQE